MKISKNNYLNIFRLLFALQVVYTHAVEWLHLPRGGEGLYTFINLFPGVPLFFLTSGFLITDSYLNSKGYGEYFVKRGLRIYPALFVNILVLELAMMLGGNLVLDGISLWQYISYLFIYISSGSMGVATTVMSLSYTDLYGIGGFFPIYPSGVLWTLSVEVSFYLLLPLLLMKNKWGRYLTLFMAFFGSVYISSHVHEGFYSQSSLHALLGISALPYLWMFIIGVFIRLFWRNLKNYLENKGLIYLAIYLIFSYMSYKYFPGNMNYRINLDSIKVIKIILLSVSIISLAFSYTKYTGILKVDLSYATYLYHMLVIHILINLEIVKSGYIYYLLLSGTLLIAYVSWRYIEKPMLLLKPKDANV